MNLFIDCEWNSWQGQLLSIALIPEHTLKQGFYQEFCVTEKLDPWVIENVLPHLKDPDPKTTYQVQMALERFLSWFDSVHVIADWPEDIERFCRLLITGPGERINTPPLTFEIIRCDPISKIPHYALEDARALREWYLGNKQTL